MKNYKICKSINCMKIYKNNLQLIIWVMSIVRKLSENYMRIICKSYEDFMNILWELWKHEIVWQCWRIIWELNENNITIIRVYLENDVRIILY